MEDILDENTMQCESKYFTVEELSCIIHAPSTAITEDINTILREIDWGDFIPFVAYAKDSLEQIKYELPDCKISDTFNTPEGQIRIREQLKNFIINTDVAF